MTQERPLLELLQNHDVLFSELAKVRNNFISHIALHDHIFHKTPKLITESGNRLSIEPERSIVVRDYHSLKGVKSVLNKIPGFKIITGSDLGFRYPTAAIAGSSAPFIKRFRSEYFHRVDEGRDICRPLNLSYGIKSRGKSDNRQEYEVWIPDDHLEIDPTSLFIQKYAEDLPDDIRAFASTPSIVHGWMGVKRCAFEAVYQNDECTGELIIVMALSIDAYNIGAKPDLSLSQEVGGSIATSNAEFEWEVMGYYAPKGKKYSNKDIWNAINSSIEALSEPLKEQYYDAILPIELSKTERILQTIADCGNSDEYIKEMNLQPYEFLQTRSLHRTKSHDPARKVNLLGRLNRLFYQPEYRLPSLHELHNLAAQDL